MFDTIKTLLDFGKALFGLKADLEKTNLERRKRIADYLDKVADSLCNIVAGFRDNRLPHEACGALGGYVRSLIEAVGTSIEPEQLESYSSLLSSAALTRQLLYEVESYEVESADKKEKALANLELASGEFRAIANFLRV
jgi:hypothetical protein